MMSASKIKQDAPMSVLFTMLFAGQIASTIFLPGLPSIAAELNIPRSIVQTMVPVYLAAFASTQLIIGPLSDKFGRKMNIIITGNSFLYQQVRRIIGSLILLMKNKISLSNIQEALEKPIKGKFNLLVSSRGLYLSDIKYKNILN